MAVANRDRVIALAGVCQCSAIVSEIARTGNCDQTMLKNMFETITMTHPEDTESVFGGVNNLQTGISQLIAQFDPNGGTKNGDVTRYSVSLLALERKINSRKGVFDQLAQRVEHIKRQLDHQSITDDQVISNLASIYIDIISPAGPRIQVAGNPAYLKIRPNQDKIRALLLAGLRSAILWRQVGGSRMQLILSRRAMLNTAIQIRSSL